MSIFDLVSGLAGLAGLTGKIVGSVISGVTVTNEMIEKFFDSIEQKMEPIYSGDFDNVSKSLRSYRNKNVHGYSETEKEEYVNVKILENAIRFVDYYKYSLKPLPPENSEYDKALKNWRIFEEFKTAEKYFLNSIDKEEQTRTSAICDYIDFVSQKRSNGHAVKELKKYIKLYGEQSELLEKAVVLYSLTDNIKQLHKTLTLLIDKKSDSKEETENLLLRLAECEYKLGHFKKSIKIAEKTVESDRCFKRSLSLIVDSYIALSEYDKARDKLKHFIPVFFLENTRLFFYLHNRIDCAEQHHKIADEFNLDNDNFIANHFDKLKNFKQSNVSKYDLKLLLHEMDGIKDKKGKKEIKDWSNLSNDFFYAAYITEHLYGRTEEYYIYLSQGLLYLGVCFDEENKEDTVKSCFLSALKTLVLVQNCDEIEAFVIELYLSVSDFHGSFSLGPEGMRQLIELSIEHDSIGDIEHRIIRYGSSWRNFLIKEGVFKEHYSNILKEADKRFDEAESCFNDWLAFVKKDVDFKGDFKSFPLILKDSILTFESDKKFIDKYLGCVAKMEEFYKYNDFDNRMSILLQVLNGLKGFEANVKKDDRTTIFFENYLGEIIAATKNNLQKLITRTRKDFATKITLEIPNTNVVPDESGNVTLSIRIANAENRAPAKNMKLSVENTAGQEIFLKDLSEKNLIGGASVSELIMIPTESKDAFDVKIIVCYDSGSVEKSVQITVDSGKNFVKIKNPYIAGNIVPAYKNEVFFGRDDFIKSLELSLKDDRTRCVIIYGQKRSGKSSIFEHLKRKLVDKFIVVDFTLQSDALNEQYFYKCVQKNLCHVLKKNHYDEKSVKTWKYREISDFLDFEDFIQEVQEDICEPENKEILLMIDEFTRIYDSKNQTPSMNNFMDKWKAMVEKNLFKSALIGQVNMPEFIRAYPNQFQVTDPIPVSYLEPEYAKELIVNPILKDGKSRYQDGADEKIAYWFNCQPFYIQTYCRKLVDYLNKTKKESITMAVAKEVKNQMLSECYATSLFDNLVEKNDEVSWSVLEKIASSDVEDVPVDISSLSEDEKIALDKLTDREVLTKKQDRYTIKIPFFREWIREYK